MNLKDATVLIADDEVDLLEILKLWFEREGSRVLTAENGAIALELLGRNRVDIVVSDVRMPVMDGIELAKRIKEMPDHSPRIIFITGFSDFDERECRELGVDAILPKPIMRRDIVSVAQQSLTGS